MNLHLLIFSTTSLKAILTNQVFRRNCAVPAANISETDNDFTIALAVPGLSKEDFKIEIENNLLTIFSEKKESKEENTENYTRKEFMVGSFSRSFTLPKSIDTEKIQAQYNNGILNVVLPKKEEEKNAKFKREIAIA
jgi:HSP20 family protein